MNLLIFHDMDKLVPILFYLKDRFGIKYPPKINITLAYTIIHMAFKSKKLNRIDQNLFLYNKIWKGECIFNDYIMLSTT